MIKDNLLEQFRVICPDVDFNEVGLDKIVVNDRIVTTLDDDNEEDLDDPKLDPANPAVNP